MSVDEPTLSKQLLKDLYQNLFYPLSLPLAWKVEAAAAMLDKIQTYLFGCLS